MATAQERWKAASAERKRQTTEQNTPTTSSGSSKPSSSSSQKLTSGVIQGKVYNNVTYDEILRNKLNSNTQARIDVSKSKTRQDVVRDLAEQESQKKAYNFSLNRLNQGIGTSRDLLVVQGRVSKQLIYLRMLRELKELLPLIKVMLLLTNLIRNLKNLLFLILVQNKEIIIIHFQELTN